jgi:ABC-2 type transport system permease protein
VRKYRAFFKNYLATVFEYRAVGITWAVIELVILSSGIFLWSAVYREQSDVRGYDLSQMIFYYALIPLISSFTYSYVTSSLPKQIKDGRISVALLKPYSLTIVNFLRQVSMKLVQQVVKMPFFLTALAFLFHFFKFDLRPQNLLLALFFSVFAFVLHFFLDLSISFSAFWFDEIWSLSHLKLVAILIFGGMSFPLDLIPGRFRPIFDFLPFRFFYFLPISIAQGKLSFSQTLLQFLALLAWLCFFYCLARFLWKKGVKKYGAYGG